MKISISLLKTSFSLLKNSRRINNLKPCSFHRNLAPRFVDTPYCFAGSRLLNLYRDSPNFLSTTPNVESKEESQPPKSQTFEEDATSAREAEQEIKLEIESLVATIAEKDVEIEEKKSEIEKLKDGILRTYAEMENLRERTKREVDSSRKFAVQSFAKELLDVGDNLARAVSVVPEKFRASLSESGEALKGNETAKLLSSLLEGVMLTEQQLLKVFSKHGLKRFEPIGEVFDPNIHNALFEVPDPEKAPGTIAVVMKAGYMLHDRVIRPAEVGVVREHSG